MSSGVDKDENMRNKENKDNAAAESKAEKEGKTSKGSRKKRTTPKDDNEFKPKVTMPHNNTPTYYLGGGNGIPM